MGLFHKHMWKDIDEEYLRTIRKKTRSGMSDFYKWRAYKVHAVTQKCFICNKKRIKEIVSISGAVI